MFTTASTKVPSSPCTRLSFLWIEVSMSIALRIAWDSTLSTALLIIGLILTGSKFSRILEISTEIARSQVKRPGLAAPGHLRSNADYVFARRPDYILIPRRGTKMITAPSLSEIWAHPELEAHYEWDGDLIGYRRLREKQRER